MKVGKKVELLKKDPRVCIEFSIFNDFPDKKYKGHYHDYRSVIAKGKMKMLDYKDDPETWEKGYNLLYTCNDRAIKPLIERKVIPGIYIGAVSYTHLDVYKRQSDECAICLSYSGETPTLLKTANFLKENKVPIIAITSRCV